MATSVEEEGVDVSSPTSEGYTVPLKEDKVDDTPEEVAVMEEQATNDTNNNTTVSVDLQFIDHFSLKQPSSTIRSRRGKKQVTTHVYDLPNDQLQLSQCYTTTSNKEEGKDTEGQQQTTQTTTIQVITKMKRSPGINIGLSILRIFYTLVALLNCGFIFIFALSILVYQCMEIPRNSGQQAGESINVEVMIATILSLPLFVYSLASLMIYSVVFVADVWRGHDTFRLLLPKGRRDGVSSTVSSTVLEWYQFIMYLGIPLLVFIIASFSKSNETGRIAGLTWYFCMLISFFLFCGVVFVNEIKLCIDLVRSQSSDSESNNNWKVLLKQAVLTTLTMRYCGIEYRYYLESGGGSDGEDEDMTSKLIATSDEEEDVKSTPDQPQESLKNRRWLYSWSTMLSFNPFFNALDTPIRQYSIEELGESVPIVSRTNFGLSRTCCALTNGQSKYTVGGTDAIEKRQYISGFVCSIIGINLSLICLIAVLYAGGFLGGTTMIVVVYVLVFVLIGVPCMACSYGVFQAMRLNEDREEGVEGTNNNEVEEVFQSWKTYIISKPKEWYCWFRLIMATVFFFLWPVISLFVHGLPKYGVLFLFLSLFSAFRLNLDARSIICEHCSLSEVKLVNDEDDSKEQMLARARASQVLGKITHSFYYFIFILVFGIMGGYFIYWSASSTGSGEDFNTQSGREPIRLLDDFYYPSPEEGSMLYTNCKLTNHFSIPGLDNTYALDYNLLGGIAYETPEMTSYVMDKWFLEAGLAVDETDFVTQWRKDSGNELNQVSFKLFSFPNFPGVGILSIRGTETPIDRLNNAQMYLGTALGMVVRALMPFSWLWNPIYPDLLQTTSWVASDQLQKSEYYRVTTDFVNDLLVDGYSVNGKSFQWLRSTGVSLGGGLALITVRKRYLCTSYVQMHRSLYLMCRILVSFNHRVHKQMHMPLPIHHPIRH